MPTPAQVQEDLQGAVRGDLLFDDVSCTLYSTDASLYQVRPLGVVVPRDEEDVRTVVRYAAEHQLPITGRGAGSGVTGESLSPGLILDFTKYFRGILEITADTVRVQPGVVYRDLQAALAKTGRRFAPDTASGAQCTLGGMLATNASGSRALKHGYTREHVLSIRAVLDDASVENLGQEPSTDSANAASRKQAIASALLPLLEQHAELIRACQPRTQFNRCGYLLHDVLTPAGVDLARLVVGSEGTLALFTEATLRTVPMPAERSLVLLGFSRLELAARAVLDCLPAGPSACELLDRRILTLTCGAFPEYEKAISPATEAVLLVEFESDEYGEAAALAENLFKQLQRRHDLTAGRYALEEAEIAWLWRLRDLALPMLHGMPGREQPISLVEDVAIPVDQLATYLHRVQEILQQQQTTASFLIHAGAGQVHTRPFLDLTNPEHVQKARSLSESIHELALNLGGTISTQHGVGLGRTPWVSRQYGRLQQVFRGIKSIFDPKNLFNPGKIVDGEGDPLGKLLRRQAHAEPAGGWQLLWRPNEVASNCQACNGCGVCRTEAPAQRMCPMFRVNPLEAATPRAKANLLRSILGNGVNGTALSADAVREVADLCVNCKMCGHECPAHVQIPKLMLEAKALHATEHGLGRDRWVLSRTEGFAAFGSAFAPLVNPLLRNRVVRWMLEKLLGVARQRRLPSFAVASFLWRAWRRGLTRPPQQFRNERVAYFVDVFANYNDPQIAEATVAVLQHNDVDVYVPPRQVGCGMAPLAVGDVENARRMARTNLQTLADLARAGYTLVCSEPTAALMLRQDYRDLIDDPDTELVARQTTELTSYLWRLHEAGRLRTDFQPLDITVGHHVPCHLKALGLGVAGPRLLSLIPQLRATTIDVSCSGMAGTFGLAARNFQVSLVAGKPMLDRFRREDLLFGSSECSACRMQMEQGGGKRALHPVQYLALAYGLMPEIHERLGELPD
jgi:FAD/FMN-containing dehydrogenase/Fe-S oxidoreductase